MLSLYGRHVAWSQVINMKNRSSIAHGWVFFLFSFCNDRVSLCHSFSTRPGSRPGFWILTGLLGFDQVARVNFFLKKKQKSMGYNHQVFDRILSGQSTRSHQVFPSIIFYSTRSDSYPESVGSWVNSSSRVLKL